ncbi:hypothetical protein VTO73DRAFT_13249 [Trametes versicolor]
MLLSHAVLAVVYGGLLAAALPDRGGRRAYAYADADAIDAEYYYTQEDAKTDPRAERGSWDMPQRIMGMQRQPAQEPQHPPEFPHPPGPPQSPFPGHPPPEHPDHPPPDHPDGPPPRDDPPPHHPDHPPPGQPGPPGAPGNYENLTIYQFLESRKDFSRLFKVVNFTEEVTNTLNDTSSNVTFFAIPNWALPHPPKKHPKGPEHLDTEGFVQDDVLDALAAAEGLVQVQEGKDDKDRKAFLKAILKAILKYETLPTAIPLSELSKNVTYATSLTLSDGSLDGEALRIRVGSGPGLFSPHVDVNVVSRILWSIKTANGLIHVVSKPVLPPPSIFQIGFLFPQSFSTLTSALQRTGLSDAVEWREVPGSDGKHTVDGSPAVTFFAPTNRAFASLPGKLKFFLFSPLGERVLKKLLQFHIVPELVLHADYLHNASESDAAPVRRAWTEDMDWDIFGGLASQDNRDDILAPAHAADGTQYGNIRTGKFPGAVRCNSCQSSRPEGFWPEPTDDRRERHRSPRPEGQWPHGGPPPPPHRGEGPHDPWAPHPPPFEHGGRFPHPHPSHEHGPLPPPPPPPFEHGPHPHHHHGPPPPPFEHGPHPRPHHHHGPPPPEVHYHYHFHPPPPPPPPHHGHPYEESPGHFPPHFPEHGPHFPEHGPPPPPHHPPFEHDHRFPPSHFPEDGARHPPFEHGPPPFEHGPHHPPFDARPPPPPHHPPFEHRPEFPPPPPRDGPHGAPGPHPPTVSYSRNITVPTLNSNHSLNVHVVQFAHTIPIPGHARTFYQTVTFAHGTRVALSDIPTRNGVLHVVDKLFNPRHKGAHPHNLPGAPKEGEEALRFGDFAGPEEDEWAGWEEWLPLWADEE